MALLATPRQIAEKLGMPSNTPTSATSQTTATQEPLIINSAEPISSGRFYYKLDTNQGEYFYTPYEFVNKGLLQGTTQFFDQGFIRNPDILKEFKPVKIQSGLIPNLENAGYENANNGFLFKRDQAKYLLGGGKETFSDWDNATQNGWVDLYDINDKSNTGGQFGAITGLATFNGSPVYVRPTEGGWQSSYIIPYDQFDAGFSLRNTKTTIEKKGGFLGDVIRGVGSAFGSVPVLGDVAAFALGGPALLGIAKGGQVASAGGSPMEAFKAGAISGGLLSAGQALSQPGQIPGIEGFAQAADEVGGAGAMLPTPSVPGADYSLLGTANLPTQAPGMGGGTGISATLPPLPEPSAIGIQPIDYGLSGQTLPGIVGGIGLQQPTMPNIGVMGGGQGVTVPVEGGTVGALGFTPENAVPVLGSPGSFINQPEVLGQPVMQQGTPTSPISVQDALRGARMINNLLTPQQPQVPNLLQRGQQVAGQAGGVDYSALLSLLSQRASTPGLLGTRYQPQSINLASLLG